MIELSRHIEILLLTNDCVIVPELGGFMTHHVSAHYDDEEHLFLPPLRTLGFNPQLKMNDSLLVQSYVEAYDVSYPEALRRIETEVHELKQKLTNEGVVELNGLGAMCLNEDGNLIFEPCEAGILTPSLYGLSSFEMRPLVDIAIEKTHAVEPVIHRKNMHIALSSETEETDIPVEDNDETEHAIVIKMSWIRNAIAVAAAVISFFFIAPPIGNGNLVSPDSVSRMEMVPIPSKPNTDIHKLPEQIIKEKVQAVKTTPSVPTKDTKIAPRVYYCLVLASQVAQHNAEYFVEQLHSKGYNDARIHMNHHVRRVVCGSYSSESEAYRILNRLRQNDETFEDAWVYKIVEE